MLKVEVADTPYKQATGLMFRQDLPDDAGMLFKFPKSDIHRFWGENTLIPLDIAFVDKKDKIIHIAGIDVMSRKMVSSMEPCVAAIEANRGFFKHHGISEGFKVNLHEDQYNGLILTFESPE